MIIFNFLKRIKKSIFGASVIKLNIGNLPSQGFFYKNDFVLKIKEADISDINEYENNYVKDDIGVIIYYVKKIVERNIILSNGYKYDDIKSIDIIYIFLEIVKLTRNKKITLRYFNIDKNKEDIIEFCDSNFNYFRLNELAGYYNSDEKLFNIYGYKFTLPSIGIENSLTKYLVSKSDDEDSSKYNNYFYDFTFFLADKNSLSESEIDNLINIFNFDIDSTELIKIKDIIDKFSLMQRYSLLKDDKVIELNSKIDLGKIWK